jgi:hypothetical protein
MLTPDTVRFIKLRNGENIVAHTEMHDDFMYLARPIQIQHDNVGDYEEQQILHIKEWVPPLIAKFDYLTVSMKDVLFVLEVQKNFLDNYIEVSEIFFSIIPDEDMKKKVLQENADKTVVSFEDVWKSIKKH